MTQSEKDKNLVALAEVKKTIIMESQQFSPTVGEKAAGRPKSAPSQELLAKEIGIPQQTLSDAYSHVRVLEKYPQLEGAPRKEAIRRAKELDSQQTPKPQPKIKVVKNDTPQREKGFPLVN